MPANPAQPLVAVDRDIGEDEIGVLTLQREQDFADSVGDWEHHTPAALPQPDDLPGAEIHLAASAR